MARRENNIAWIVDSKKIADLFTQTIGREKLGHAC